MRIGLVRHHKVLHPFPKKIFLSKEEILAWFDGYNQADIEPKIVDMRGVEWSICFSSPMKRSLQTAHQIFHKDILIRHELSEMDAMPLLNQKLRLPFLVWALLIRFKMFSRHPHVHGFKNQIRHFLDSIPKDGPEDILVVSHGVVMTFLQQELADRGFKGENFRSPAYGRIYIFHKTERT